MVTDACVNICNSVKHNVSLLTHTIWTANHIKLPGTCSWYLVVCTDYTRDHFRIVHNASTYMEAFQERFVSAAVHVQQDLEYQQRVFLTLGSVVLGGAYLRLFISRLSPGRGLLAVAPLLVLNCWLPLTFHIRDEIMTRATWMLLLIWLANFKVCITIQKLSMRGHPPYKASPTLTPSAHTCRQSASAWVEGRWSDPGQSHRPFCFTCYPSTPAQVFSRNSSSSSIPYCFVHPGIQHQLD